MNANADADETRFGGPAGPPLMQKSTSPNALKGNFYEDSKRKEERKKILEKRRRRRPANRGRNEARIEAAARNQFDSFDAEAMCILD